MRVSEDRYVRDLRRIHLAQRMIGYEVRTTTICRWTGFNEERIRNLTKSYEAGLHATTRHRGPPPKKLDIFLRQTLLRTEAACLAGLARAFHLVPAARIAEASRSLPGVPLGEKLCDTFAVYREVVPEARLSMEYFILIVLALAEGQDIELDHCGQCSAVILLSPGSVERRICVSCLAIEARGALKSNPALDDEPSAPVPPEGIQQVLF